MKRWCFTERDKRLPVWWTWRVDGDDGGITQVSEGFATYGEAVLDAIRKGYRPCEDRCVLETRHAVVHFGPGKRAVSVIKPGTRRADLGKNRSSKVAAAGNSPAPARPRPGHDRKRVAAE
jgi:hypothetical protein